jgi:condensin complex subunit 3
MSLRAEIGSIFEQAQRTCASHSRCFKQLEKCHKRDPDNFVQCFTSLLKRVLVIFKQFPNVERIVHFIVDFSQRTELRVSNSEPFALFLLRHLLPFTAVSRTARGQAEISKAIRFRSCQLIAGILNVLSEETEIE